MKYITLIPARGGSKRFPGKNVHPLCGKPLIAYSIEYSQANEHVAKTYVSTDAPEIKEVSAQFGAEVLDRSDELSGDFVTTAAVMQDAVKKLMAQGVEFDFVVLLQATNPLRPKAMLEEAIAILETGQYDSLFTVNRCDLKLGRIKNHEFIPWNYHFGQRSQDLEPLYYENGLLYITSRDVLLDGRIMGDKCYAMEMDHPFGEIDIDLKEDLDLAEFTLQKYSDE